MSQPNAPAARFSVGDRVIVLVGSKARERAEVEYAIWHDRDRCYYFYLVQRPTSASASPKKFSRGYLADELEGAPESPEPTDN